MHVIPESDEIYVSYPLALQGVLSRWLRGGTHLCMVLLNSKSKLLEIVDGCVVRGAIFQLPDR